MHAGLALLFHVLGIKTASPDVIRVRLDAGMEGITAFLQTKLT
jgi:hypothetical protein